ncbi:MAG: GNAT family N-acetyltransferase [Elusimicrobiota bacterium]|nr:GNAT family N-acetyltransferase [Elusimicrobiota bacterium]
METPRLRLRALAAADAPFIVRLLNDPDWLRFIGDRGVRTLADAGAYIERNLAARTRNGFGLDMVELPDGTPLGLCGLIRRPGLDDADLGFAFLPEHRGKGYAREAAAAVLADADARGFARLCAITSQNNEPSMRLLERLGFRFERLTRLPGDEEELRLYGRGRGGA